MDQDKSQFKLGKVEVGLIVLVITGIIGAGAFSWYSQNKKQNSVDSFADCVAAGNPVMESYPQQCSANGKVFTDEALDVLNNTDTGSRDEYRIPELGLAFTKTAAMTQLYHIQDTDDPRIVFFSVEQYRGTECDDLAAITKLSEQEVDTDEWYAAKKESMIRVSNAFVLVEGAQAACSEDDVVNERVSVIKNEILSSLNDSLRTIE